MEGLSKRVTIGKVLQGQPGQAGIHTPEELARAGSRDAWTAHQSRRSFLLPEPPVRARGRNPRRTLA